MEAESYSYSLEHQLVYKWHVKDITSVIESVSLAAGEINIDSPKFSTGAKIKDLWFIRLKIQEYQINSSSTRKNILVKLVLINKESRVRTKYEIFILSNEGRKIALTRYSLGENPSIPVRKNFPLIREYIGDINAAELLKKAGEFLKNDTLTIVLDLTVYDNYQSIENPINMLKGNKRSISDDFKDLLVTKKKSDIIIIVGSKKFYAHKIILSVRSCVFDAMFSHEMKENLKNEVTIPDMSPEIFEKVLVFIYTDEVGQLEKFVEELLEASDRYQLQGLKEKCEDYLASNLRVDNSVEVLILADRHHAKRLKETVTTYIIVNYVDIENIEDFKKFKESYPSLFCELLQKYIEKIKIH